MIVYSIYVLDSDRSILSYQRRTVKIVFMIRKVTFDLSHIINKPNLIAWSNLHIHQRLAVVPIALKRGSIDCLSCPSPWFNRYLMLLLYDMSSVSARLCRTCIHTHTHIYVCVCKCDITMLRQISVFCEYIFNFKHVIIKNPIIIL